MRRLLVGGAAALLLSGSLAGPASGAQVSGYDGSNPFNCVLQQAGLGTAFPDPDADPFCVEYDKTHQNVSEGGVVDFLAQEPARVAAAREKCFYYQRDHWRGSVVQSDGRTETYAWDGSYFYDRARGVGGAYVENFRIAGQAGDPTLLPGFPDEYRPFFGNGRGGVQTSEGFEVDARCQEQARRTNPYRRGGPGGGAPPGRGGGRGRGSSPRVRVSGVPRRCTSRSFRARIEVTSRISLRRVDVFLDGRRVARTTKARFGLRVHARRLAVGRHRLSVVAADRAGGRGRASARFSRCRRLRFAG